MLLWAIGALAGWWLLRQWPQLGFAALLVPFWLIGEWTEAALKENGSLPVVAAFCTLLAICYLSVPDRAFAWVGGIGLLPAILMTILRRVGGVQSFVPGMLGLIGWSTAFLLPLGFAFLYRKTAVWMNAVAAVWVGILSSLTFQHTPVLIFAWCAIGSVGMIAWGIYEFRAERVNLGMAGLRDHHPGILFFERDGQAGPFHQSDRIRRGVSRGRLVLGEAAPQTGGTSDRGRCRVNLFRKGILLAGLQCALVLSLAGKLVYDRATRPRVWVKTQRYDPDLPIRGRYLSLQLAPEGGAPYFDRTRNQRVVFFVPEHSSGV